MKRNSLIILIILLALVGPLTILAAKSLSNEDDWLCVEGEWIKHGNPSRPMPADGCGEKISPDQQPLASPDSQILKTLRLNLHGPNSGTEARQLLPDLVPVYVDNGHGNRNLPQEVLPFTYYYSPLLKATISICNINQTVFICPGKLDRQIQEKDFSTCQVATEYLEAERL